MAQILIVDNDAALAETWRRALSGAGHQVMVSGDGRSALDLVDQTPPELAITEIILPSLGGVGFTGKVKLKDPGIKVVAITGDPAALDASVGGLALAGRVGADLLLEKPIAEDDLVAAVNRLLAET